MQRKKSVGFQLLTRIFDDPSLIYHTEGIMVLREVDRVCCGRIETIRYAVTVSTNHDTAAYCTDVVKRAECIDSLKFDDLKKKAW